MLLHIFSVFQQDTNIRSLVPRLIDCGGVTYGSVFTGTKTYHATNRSLVVRVVVLDVSPVKDLVIGSVDHVPTRIVRRILIAAPEATLISPPHQYSRSNNLEPTRHFVTNCAHFNHSVLGMGLLGR